MTLMDATPGETWRHRAVCQHLPTGWFFTEEGTTQKESKLPGMKVCRQWCPVRAECLAFAYKTKTRVGVFGGYSSSQRQRLRKKLDHRDRPA